MLLAGTEGATASTCDQVTTVATGTINDAQTAPTFAISGGSATEGGQVTFTVTRTGDAQAAETIQYSTSNGTATAGSDYTAASGTLTFNQGETQKTFTVQTAADTLYEGTETFSAAL